MLRFLRQNMPAVRGCINHILPRAALLLALAGCATSPEEKRRKLEAKDVAQIRFYREETGFEGGTDRVGALGTTRVKVGRGAPAEFSIQNDAFLDERDVKRARLVEEPGGGYLLGLEFNRHGALVLHMNSVAALGRHIVVAARWSDRTNAFQRWIAAPIVRQAADQGALVFTPDLSREEARMLVRGLNNVAVKLENQAKPKKAPKEAKPEKPDPGLRRDFDPTRSR